MIDATGFSASYSAFWNDCTPTCERFVRRLNLNGLERAQPPMPRSETTKRALISELAFSVFVEIKKDSIAGGEKRDNSLLREAAWIEAERRLTPYTFKGLELSRDLGESDRDEINQITRRLSEFFGSDENRCILRPMFAGCGYVDESEADVLFGGTIYEVKTVDRPFRSNDIRQVITYAALNFSSGQFNIANVGLYSPRRGQYCDLPLDHICSEISGMPAQELLRIVIQAVSSGEISR